ncbi:MAG: methyltransferase domain-containing protein [bacterium]|nr:methyltransferase domain-containing protein [bacterium]
MTQRDLWNERYGQRGAVWGVDPNEFVADRLGDLSPRRVLDLGSGQGRNAIWLARQGHAVTAVDVSDVATDQAAQMAAAAGVEVEFIAADVAVWEPEAESFDLVVLAYFQGPEAMRKAIHHKARRALVSGGRVFVVAHHRDNLEHGFGGPPMIEVLFDEADVAADFAGFGIIENAKVVRHVEKDDVVGDALDLVFLAVKPG